MSSYFSVGLYSIYTRIEEAATPVATLGLADNRAPSASDVRSSYRQLALRLHPDEFPSPNLLALHTELFLKVQQAYEQLQKRLDRGFVGEDGEVRVVRLLKEPPLALHARVLDFKQALKNERSRAVAAKRAEDDRKAAAKAKYAAQPVRMADKVAVRKAKTEAIATQHRKAIEKRHRAAHRATGSFSKSGMRKAVPSSGATARPKQVPHTRIIDCGTGEATAHDKTPDNPFATKGDIQHRRQKSVLSGSPACVSIVEKVRREQLAAAKTQAGQLRLGELLERGLLSPKQHNDAFSVTEHSVSPTADKKLAGLTREDRDLSHSVWIDDSTTGSTLAAKLGLLSVDEAPKALEARHGRAESIPADLEEEEDLLAVFEG